MEERKVTFGTRDRFGEFNSLRDKLISETSKRDTAIESRSLIPKVMFSKKRKRIAKLEKRQRRTNRDTEEFLKHVSLIKKKIESLKVKVEEVRKKQGIIFTAPSISDEEFAELEKSEDAIYSDCYTIQTQIKSLEGNPGSRYGSYRKMQYMQKEYLLSQLTSVMNEFRLMQTGYVDKRKQQYKENWVLSTEKTPNGTKPVETSNVEEEFTSISEQEKPKLHLKFRWKRNKSKSKSKGEEATDTACENKSKSKSSGEESTDTACEDDFKNNEKSTNITEGCNSQSVTNTVTISCQVGIESLNNLDIITEKVEISSKGKKAKFFNPLKRRTSKSKFGDEELIGKHKTTEGDIKNKLKTDISNADNSPKDELITNSVNMSKVSETKSLKSTKFITEKVENTSNGKNSKGKSKPGNEECPDTHTSDFKNEEKTNNVAKGDNSTKIESTNPTVTVLSVAGTECLKVSNICIEKEESSKKEKSQFFSNFPLKRRTSKSKFEESELTSPITAVDSDKPNNSTKCDQSVIVGSTTPTLMNVTETECLKVSNISTEKEESDVVVMETLTESNLDNSITKEGKFRVLKKFGLKREKSRTKSTDEKTLIAISESEIESTEIFTVSVTKKDNSVIETSNMSSDVSKSITIIKSDISTENNNDSKSKEEKSKGFKKFLFKRSKSQSINNGEETVKLGGEHEFQTFTASIEDEEVFDGDHSQVETLSSSNMLAKESGLRVLKEAAVMTVNKSDSISKGDKSNFFSKFQLKRKKSRSKTEGEETPLKTYEDSFQIEKTASIGVTKDATVQKVEMLKSTEKSVHTSVIAPTIQDNNEEESISDGIKRKSFIRFSFRGKKNKTKVSVEEEEPLNSSYKEGLEIEEAVNNYLQQQKVVADTKISQTEDDPSANLRFAHLKDTVVDDKVTKSESFSKGDKMKLFDRFSFRRSKSYSDSKTNLPPVEEVELQCKKTVVSQELNKGHNSAIEMDIIEEKSLGPIDSNQIQGQDQLDIELETEKSKLELEEIKKREGRLKRLEENILEMNELHKEMYSIVNSGGDQMNNIEYYVDTAKYNVEEGREELIKAEGWKKKYLKRKIICGVVVIILIIIVTVIVLPIAL